jgi:C4-dicarboxylate-specific signal transduction histidine kinase
LRNSLSYVGHLSTSPGFDDQNFRLGALATAILQLTLDSSARAQQAVEERLLEVARQAPVEADQGTAQALISHARLLKILLPSVDDTLRGLFAVQTGPPLEETRTQFARLHIASESSAQRFRLLLYATSILLALALIDLGRRLRARAVALRKRAAFEHLIAEQSARLINCPPAETKARLEHALAKFGRTIEADRVYIVLGENPIRVYAWSENDAPYPPGWPERALSLPGEFKQVGLGVITTPDVARLPFGDARKTLLNLGIRAWACVVLQQAGYDRCILGFDRLRPARGLYFPLSAVRLAGDMIANVLEREKHEIEKAKLTARLERALRLQLVGQLASGVAHNFNNIVSAIVGYSEMASSEVEPGGKAARRIAEIEKAAERGRDLVDSILTFGRRSDARSSLILITELLSETSSLLRASLPPSVELFVADAPGALAIFGERAQLQQVIVNLCRNAAQAMGESGRIDVSADMRRLMTARVFSIGELESGPMFASPSAMLAPALEKTSPNGCSSLFLRRAPPEPASASQQFARSFAITTAQSTLPARRGKGAASRSGCPPPRLMRQRQREQTQSRRPGSAKAKPCSSFTTTATACSATRRSWRRSDMSQSVSIVPPTPLPRSAANRPVLTPY